MHSRIFSIFIFLCFSFNSYAQKSDSDTLIVRIKSAITSFFINHRLLKNDDIKGNVNTVFATELIDHKTLGYSTNGIYEIGVLQSHSPSHVLMKENMRFKILDIEQINETLKEVINYSTRNNISVDSMFKYTRAIMDIYDMNNIVQNPARKIPNQ